MPLFSISDLYNSQNVPKTREMIVDGTISMSKVERPGKINLYKLFVLYCVDDPSEVTFAMEVFGDLNFWLKMQKDHMVRDHVEEWREHCDILRKQAAFVAISKEVKEGKSPFAAARYLIEEPWKQARGPKAKKALVEKKERTAEEAYRSAEISKDLERIKEVGKLPN